MNPRNMTTEDLRATLKASLKEWRRCIVRAHVWEGRCPDDCDLTSRQVIEAFSPNNPHAYKMAQQSDHYRMAWTELARRGEVAE